MSHTITDVGNSLKNKTGAGDPERSSKQEKSEDDDLVPFWCQLSKNFYRNLARDASRLGLSRAAFIQDAVKHYVAFREKATSAAKLTVTEMAALKKFREVQARATKNWWETLTPEERRARAEKASKAAAAARSRRR